MIRELDIDFADGSAIVTKDGKIELIDVHPFTVKEAEYLIEEVKAFLRYRIERNSRPKQAPNKEEDL